MELGAREMGKKRGAEKSSKRVEDRWGERARAGGSGAESWGVKESQEWRERDVEQDSRRQGETGEETGKWERRNWGARKVPEVRGTRVYMWALPSNSVIFPRALNEDEEAAEGRRSCGGWPSQPLSSLPPETSFTRLPRMQHEVEPPSSSNLGNPSTHREAGMQGVWGADCLHPGTVRSLWPQCGLEQVTGIPK
jgi:hypothetical protein